VAAIDDCVVPYVVDLVTVDVSYLRVADAVRSLLRLRLAPQAGLVALIKPTFELRAGSLVTDARAVRHAIHIAAETIDATGWRAEAYTHPCCHRRRRRYRSVRTRPQGASAQGLGRRDARSTIRYGGSRLVAHARRSTLLCVVKVLPAVLADQ
jgi:hypothetical protein